MRYTLGSFIKSTILINLISQSLPSTPSASVQQESKRKRRTCGVIHILYATWPMAYIPQAQIFIVTYNQSNDRQQGASV